MSISGIGRLAGTFCLSPQLDVSASAHRRPGASLGPFLLNEAVVCEKLQHSLPKQIRFQAVNPMPCVLHDNQL